MNPPMTKPANIFIKLTEPDRGTRHVVIAQDAHEIITWSQPLRHATEDVAGFSWMGSPGQFGREFKPDCTGAQMSYTTSPA